MDVPSNGDVGREGNLTAPDGLWDSEGGSGPFFANITGNNGATSLGGVMLYSWQRMQQTGEVSYTADPGGATDGSTSAGNIGAVGTFPAFELNGSKEVPTGTIVELRACRFGDAFWFDSASGILGGDEIAIQNSTTTIGGGLWSFNLIEPTYSGGVVFLTDTGLTIDVKDADLSLSASTVGKYGNIIPTNITNTTTGHAVGILADLTGGGTSSGSVSSQNILYPYGLPVPTTPAGGTLTGVTGFQWNNDSGIAANSVTGDAHSVQVFLLEAQANTPGSSGWGAVSPNNQIWDGIKTIFADMYRVDIGGPSPIGGVVVHSTVTDPVDEYIAIDSFRIVFQAGDAPGTAGFVTLGATYFGFIGSQFVDSILECNFGFAAGGFYLENPNGGPIPGVSGTNSVGDQFAGGICLAIGTGGNAAAPANVNGIINAVRNARAINSV
jgi:hypothetical protein